MLSPPSKKVIGNSLYWKKLPCPVPRAVENKKMPGGDT